MLAAAGRVAGRPEVAGQILEVDGDAAVRGAYAAWDATALLDRRRERRGRSGQRSRCAVPRGIAGRALRRPRGLRRRAPDDAAARPGDHLERNGRSSGPALHAAQRQCERSLCRRRAGLLPQRQRLRRVHNCAVAGPRPVSPERRRWPARRDCDGDRASTPALRGEGRAARAGFHAYDGVRLPHRRWSGSCRGTGAARRSRHADQRHLDLSEPRNRIYEQRRPGRRVVRQRALQPLAPAACGGHQPRVDGRSTRRRGRVRRPHPLHHGLSRAGSTSPTRFSAARPRRSSSASGCSTGHRATRRPAPLSTSRTQASGTATRSRTPCPSG